MIKTVNALDFRYSAEALLTAWEKEKTNIKTSGKTLFRIVALKKTLESELRTLSESLNLLAAKHHGEPTPDGQFKIPDGEVEALNAELADLYKADIEIEYSPIVLGPEDFLPVALMECLFDFLEMAE